MSVSVKMYSSAWCTFCIQAKRLLESKKASIVEINVDGKPAVRQQMINESHRQTVPQIWIGQTYVGGCDDLFDLERRGLLDSLLKKAKQ